jgi:hypothetical protein
MEAPCHSATNWRQRSRLRPVRRGGERAPGLIKGQFGNFRFSEVRNCVHFGPLHRSPLSVSAM